MPIQSSDLAIAGLSIVLFTCLRFKTFLLTMTVLYFLSQTTMYITDTVLPRRRWQNMSPEARQQALDAAAAEPICTLGENPYMVRDREGRRHRVRFGRGPGTVLRGYPSEKGGVYVLEDVLGVELEFLGVGRFGGTERVDPGLGSEEARREEDAWCAKREDHPL